MIKTSEKELEQIFTDHGISRHRLYPWWYRLYRLLGLDVRPPIFFSLGQHYLYVGGLLVAISGTAAWYNWCCMTTPMRALIPLFAYFSLTPLWNWWSYRRLRRRLGL